MIRGNPAAAEAVGFGALAGYTFFAFMCRVLIPAAGNIGFPHR